MYAKYSYHICPPSSFLMLFLVPWVLPLQTEHIFSSCSSFFKYILIVQGGLVLVFQIYILFYFKQIKPPLLTLSLSSAPLLLNSSQCIGLYYLYMQMQCFNIFQSLTSMTAFLCYSLTNTEKTSFPVCLCFCISLSFTE
jgi:hypothetical protein